MNKHLFAIKQITLAYPNNSYSKTINFLRIFFWYLIILPFCKKEITIKYLRGLKIKGNKHMDGLKYSFLFPTIDYGIKFLEYKYLGKGDNFIDVGANIGNHSLIGGLRKANVYAFEPNTDVVNCLQKNIIINKLNSQNIIINNCLVGNEEKNIKFYQYPNNQSGISSIVMPDDLSKIKEIEKRMISLDVFIEHNHINHIKILKIDTEGAEPLVFEGSKDSLKSGIIDVIFRESNAILTKTQKENILEILKKYKYENFEFTSSEKGIVPYNNGDNCLSIHQNKVTIIKDILNKLH